MTGRAATRIGRRIRYRIGCLMLRTAVSLLALALATPALAQAPTAAQADAFVADAEKQLEAISVPVNFIGG